MAQQTAMQALVELLKVKDVYKECMPYILEIIEEVYLPMEKEQIIKFAMKMHQVDCSKTGIDLLLDEAEQYYNETYQSNQDKPDK
jgi:hypothetical protein